MDQRRARQRLAVPVAAFGGRARGARAPRAGRRPGQHALRRVHRLALAARAFPDVVAHNFDPHVVESYKDVWPRCHNVDERIAVADLAFEAFFVEQVALELLR